MPLALVPRVSVALLALLAPVFGGPGVPAPLAGGETEGDNQQGDGEFHGRDFLSNWSGGRTDLTAHASVPLTSRHRRSLLSWTPPGAQGILLVRVARRAGGTWSEPPAWALGVTHAHDHVPPALRADALTTQDATERKMAGCVWCGVPGRGPRTRPQFPGGELEKRTGSSLRELSS